MFTARIHALTRALLLCALLAAPAAHAQVDTPTTPTPAVNNSAFHVLLTTDAFAVCDGCLYFAMSASSATEATTFDEFSADLSQGGTQFMGEGDARQAEFEECWVSEFGAMPHYSQGEDEVQTDSTGQ